jgi:hypothetical protein
MSNDSILHFGRAVEESEARALGRNEGDHRDGTCNDHFRRAIRKTDCKDCVFVLCSVIAAGLFATCG